MPSDVKDKPARGGGASGGARSPKGPTASAGSWAADLALALVTACFVGGTVYLVSTNSACEMRTETVDALADVAAMQRGLVDRAVDARRSPHLVDTFADVFVGAVETRAAALEAELVGGAAALRKALASSGGAAAATAASPPSSADDPALAGGDDAGLEDPADPVNVLSRTMRARVADFLAAVRADAHALAAAQASVVAANNARLKAQADRLQTEFADILRSMEAPRGGAERGGQARTDSGEAESGAEAEAEAGEREAEAAAEEGAEEREGAEPAQGGGRLRGADAGDAEPEAAYGEEDA